MRISKGKHDDLDDDNNALELSEREKDREMEKSEKHFDFAFI